MDAKTAQRIADEVMASLGYNINVMNEQAVIIGSGSSERLGTFHETALRAIRDRQIYEVNESEARHLLGVRPGINMPIVDRSGRVLGAVGITGNPDEVRNIGKLVKMTAELIIEQEEAMRRFYSHRNDKEFFVTTLLSEQPGLTAAELCAWGERLGYDMNLPRVAGILKSEDWGRLGGSEAVLKQMKNSRQHSKQDLSLIMPGDFILIYKALPTADPWQLAATVSDYWQEINGPAQNLLAYVGLYHPGIGGYRKSYRDAAGLARACIGKAEDGLVFAQNHLLDIIFDQEQEELNATLVAPARKRLAAAFGKGLAEAMTTMALLLDYGFDTERVAAQLYVHKNTVIFRKQKVEECLELQLKHNLNDLIMMKLIINDFFVTDKQTEKAAPPL